VILVGKRFRRRCCGSSLTFCSTAVCCPDLNMLSSKKSPRGIARVFRTRKKSRRRKKGVSLAHLTPWGRGQVVAYRNMGARYQVIRKRVTKKEKAKHPSFLLPLLPYFLGAAATFCCRNRYCPFPWLAPSPLRSRDIRPGYALKVGAGILWQPCRNFLSGPVPDRKFDKVDSKHLRKVSLRSQDGSGTSAKDNEVRRKPTVPAPDA